MSETRVIKKYPNRRLYDTVESRYITLADIRRLVVDNIGFVVIDKKTQDDITRQILLQVIAEQEQGGAPLLTRDFLSLVIRSHGDGSPELLGSYLEQSLRLFAAQARGNSRAPGDGGSQDSAAALSDRNYQRWRAVQDEIFRALSRAVPGTNT